MVIIGPQPPDPDLPPYKRNPALLDELSPDSFTLLLQPDALGKKPTNAVKKLAASQRDWVIIDPAFNEKTAFTATDVAAIRAGQARRKVLAYLSVGEAESFRPYWVKTWVKKNKLAAAAPSYLVAPSTRWKGNYSVKYWDQAWQDLVLTAVENLMDLGYDGVYLDFVDAFLPFETIWFPGKLNPESSQSYRKDMVDLVAMIADTAREINPDALVVPKNALLLLDDPDFVSEIDALALEGILTFENAFPKLTNLSKFPTLPVLLIETPKKKTLNAHIESNAKQAGFVWLTTDKAFKTLGNSGY